MNYESARERDAQAIAKRLEAACGLDVTPNAVEAIEEGLEAMRTEKDLKLASKNLVEAEKERDLEIWRQAYNAALSGYDIQRCLAERTDYCATYDPKERADRALFDYRAKREELMNK